jgi:hypothetical protein
MDQSQWRIRVIIPGEQEESDMARSFADAFAIAVSIPELEEEQGVSWVYSRRAEVRSAFEQGAQELKVVWDRNSPQERCVFIERF